MSQAPPDSGDRASLGPIRQAYALVVADRWGRWVALVALALMVSSLEALGAALVYLLIGLVSEPDAPIELPVVGDIGHWFSDMENTELLIWAAAAIGVFFVFRGALMVIQSYAQHRITYNAGMRLSVRLVRGYMAMPYSYHLKRESSELVRNAISSVQESVSKVVLPATNFLAEVLIVAGLAVVLFATAPIASLLVVAVLGPATYLVLRLVKARVKRYGRVAVDAARDSLRTLQQSFFGIRDLRVLGREKYFVDKFRRQRRRDAMARARQATFSKLTSVLVETLLMLFIVVFLIVTVTAAGTASDSFAVLGLFAYVGMRLKPSIQKIINTANNLRFATPAIGDLYRDLEENRQAALSTRSKGDSGPDVPLFTRSISLEEVSFRYEGGDQPALEMVDLEIRAGETLGICGPTGGGKSTLVDLIAGLLEPTSGRVLVDDVDIHQSVESWYRQLGLVSQEIYLFDDTFRRNIALGIPDDEIDEAAVLEAVEMAQLGDFIATLPRGLDTKVGERGVLMSGGQRQRVAIARALYRDPRVLILDEGTSALDNETEREFIGALERFRGQKTIILVAHRLTTIQKADRVVFVNNGVISGSGTYDELYEHHATFRQMAI